MPNPPTETELRVAREIADMLVASAERITRLEQELAACAEILQRLHPIGKVKAIGLLECAAALAEMERDENHEPITPEWLAAIGGAKYDTFPGWTFKHVDALYIGICCVTNVLWKAMLLFTPQSGPTIKRGLTTRGEVLELLRVLGVELTPGTDPAAGLGDVAG